MKRLTKAECAILEQAAINLTNHSGGRTSEYSCCEVGRLENAFEDLSDRYAKETQADKLIWGFSDDEYSNSNKFERQLARSLAVLMFMEANK